MCNSIPTEQNNRHNYLTLPTDNPMCPEQNPISVYCHHNESVMDNDNVIQNCYNNVPSCCVGAPSDVMFPNPSYNENGVMQNPFNYVTPENVCMPRVPMAQNRPCPIVCRQRNKYSEHQHQGEQERDQSPMIGILDITYRNTDAECCEKEVKIRCYTEVNTLKGVGRKINEMISDLSVCYPQKCNLQRFLPAPGEPEGPPTCELMHGVCDSRPSVESTCLSMALPCLCEAARPWNVRKIVKFGTAFVLVLAVLAFYCYCNMFYSKPIRGKYRII